MRDKLHSYAKDYLPHSGKFWDPSKDVRHVFQQIRLRNDICKSFSGLNDW